MRRKFYFPEQALSFHTAWTLSRHGGSLRPSADSNFVRECNVYFFGAQTARSLEIGRVNKEGMITQIVSRRYMLDRDGHPIDGVSVDWIMILALIAYLVVMETRTGATLGSRVMRIRVIDRAAPAGPNVPSRKILLRYLAMLIGSLPILVVLLVYFGPYGLDLDDIGASSFFWVFTAAGFIMLVGWIVFLSVQIAIKRDALYDTMAGTAVVRASPDAAIWGTAVVTPTQSRGQPLARLCRLGRCSESAAI